MSVPPQLNHYRIVSPLAKGGMGEVFIAEDTRLNRRVALKVLPALLAADPERRQRFAREAQAVAALNHPNIVTIHSVEEADGLPFLTMELVEGKPLSEMIGLAAGSGQPGGELSVDAVLRIGIAIADAIAAAHQRGITHRDLKPANVIVTPEGRVKVLDFGLAKLREAQLDAASEDVTRMPAPDLTGEGRIIGTVSYMSPEQAEGKPVDERTDIFSLGVMLHEMVTGERPFKGDTNVSIISAILKDTPSDITDINPALPATLARVIRKALAKDPSRRYQTATDLRNDLEEVKQDLDSGLAAATSIQQAPVRRRWAVAPWVAIALIALVVIPAGIVMAARWRSNRAARTSNAIEAGQLTRLTSGGNAFLAAVSPDGRYVAHVKTDGTVPSLWLRQTVTTSDVQIVPPEQVRYDAVSFGPDGDYVYYVTYQVTGGVGTLFRVPVLGGTPHAVLQDVDSKISFSPDRRQFAFIRGVPAEGKSLVVVANADGSGTRTLASMTGLEGFVNEAPAWSPDGRVIVAPVQSLKDGPHGAIAGIDAQSGEIRMLPGRWANVRDLEWIADGRSFIAVATEYGPGTPQVWQVSYPSGDARRITNDLNSYASVSVAANGKTIVTVQSEAVSNLWVASADGDDVGVQLTKGRSRGDALQGLDWTPDGRIVFASNASGRPQIWIINADGTNERQLTNDNFPSLSPSASADGQYIVFQRFAYDGAYIWRMKLDGSEPVALTGVGASLNPLAGTDGYVYFNAVIDGIATPWKLPIAGGEPTRVSDALFRPVDISPDGRQLVGVIWDEKARRAAAAIMPAAGGPAQMIPEVPTFGLTWGPLGRIAFWTPVDRGVGIMTAAPGGKPELLMKVEEVIFNFKFSPDAKRIAIARGQVVSDVVMITAR